MSLDNIDQSRRTFIKTLTVTGAALTVAGLIQRVASADGDYVSVGKLSDFKTGDYTSVALPDGTSIYVERSPDDPSTAVALSPVCTHKGCTVLWLSDTKEFRCPCHNGLYDKNGINISGPPPKPLRKYDTKVVNGAVQVSV